MQYFPKSKIVTRNGHYGALYFTKNLMIENPKAAKRFSDAHQARSLLEFLFFPLGTNLKAIDRLPNDMWKQFLLYFLYTYSFLLTAESGAVKGTLNLNLDKKDSMCNYPLKGQVTDHWVVARATHACCLPHSIRKRIPGGWCDIIVIILFSLQKKKKSPTDTKRRGKLQKGSGFRQIQYIKICN